MKVQQSFMNKVMNTHPLFSSLCDEDVAFISSLLERYTISYQHMRQLIEYAIDLRMWMMDPLESLWDETLHPSLKGKPRFKALFNALSSHIETIKQSPIFYEDFHPQIVTTHKPMIVEESSSGRLLGRCPCPVEGELTRCCNVLTLDAVTQCGFQCSYCSVQSFYHQGEVHFTSDLKRELKELTLPEGTWHIGTGQASDSLMWGDSHNLLSSISHFASTHPEIVVEFKTKSQRTDWLQTVPIPKNIVATWSLNAPTVIEKEEHKSASLMQRLLAARSVADRGIAVGFHLHPMVYFSDWEKEYQQVISTIDYLFSPEEVMMISFGTLTFSKSALRELRENNTPTRVHQMALTECAGKYSYPLEIKQQLFSFAYHTFPQKWKEAGGPFFYLCMEPPELWEPTLGHSYPSNDAFEQAMKHAYYTFMGI
jgi:spore photoproduct lyase